MSVSQLVDLHFFVLYDANQTQVAYFAAIPKTDLAKSEVIVAGLFFRNVFGNSAGARSLPAFVALSNLGNVLAVSFAHARVNQGMHMKV